MEELIIDAWLFDEKYWKFWHKELMDRPNLLYNIRANAPAAEYLFKVRDENFKRPILIDHKLMKYLDYALELFQVECMHAEPEDKTKPLTKLLCYGHYYPSD